MRRSNYCLPQQTESHSFPKEMHLLKRRPSKATISIWKPCGTLGNHRGGLLWTSHALRTNRDLQTRTQKSDVDLPAQTRQAAWYAGHCIHMEDGTGPVPTAHSHTVQVLSIDAVIFNRYFPNQKVPSERSFYILLYSNSLDEELQKHTLGLWTSPVFPWFRSTLLADGLVPTSGVTLKVEVWIIFSDIQQMYLVNE